MVIFNRKIDKKHFSKRLTRKNRQALKHLLIDTDSESTLESYESKDKCDYDDCSYEKYLKLMNENREYQNILNIINKICILHEKDNLNQYVSNIGNYKVIDINLNLDKLHTEYKNIIDSIKYCREYLKETLKNTRNENIVKYFENYLENFKKYIDDKYQFNKDVLNNELSRLKSIGKTISFFIVFFIIMYLLFDKYL